jgi:integrase
MTNHMLPSNSKRAAKLTMAIATAAEPPESGDYIIRSSDHRSLGLGLRVYSSGVKTWIVQKKVGKRPVRVALGPFPGITMEKAVALAKDKLFEFSQGKNPNQEKKRRMVDTELGLARKHVTVAIAFKEYEAAKKVGSAPKSMIDREAARKRLEPGSLWSIPILEVTGAALLTEHKRLVAAGKKGSSGGITQAGLTFRWLRAAINHALATREWVAANPFLKFNELQPGWSKVNPRQRIIASTEGQLKKWWDAVEQLRSKRSGQSRDSVTIADYLVLSLLFGGRRTELLSLPWTEVDLDTGTVTFTDTKNDRDHIIPFGSHARSILERRLDANKVACSAYVFNATRPSKDGHLSHIKEPKRAIASVVKASGVPFTPHDLRRTFGTLFEESGTVSALTVDRALNHAPSSTAGKHYIMQRLSRLRPLYQGLEERILEEAGVNAPKSESEEKAAVMRVRKDGDQFIASMDTPDGPLEAIGATAKEARLLLQSMF